MIHSQVKLPLMDPDLLKLQKNNFLKKLKKLSALGLHVKVNLVKKVDG
jgi:hypothetical protein